MPVEPKATVLRGLFDERTTDAEVLMKRKRSLGAIYLGGYATECLLKAAVCKQIGRIKYPARDSRYRTHNLEVLKEFCSVVAPIDKDPEAAQLFRIINSIWDISLRYDRKPMRIESVRKFLNATRDLGAWIKSHLTKR